MAARARDLLAIRGYGVLAAATALLGLAISVTMPYLALYFTTVVGISTSAYGLLMALSALSGVVVSTLVARRTDRLRTRRGVIALSAVAGAAQFAAYLLVRDYVVLLLLVVVLAAVASLAMPQIFAAARDAITDHAEGDGTFATSTLRSLFSLGYVVGPVLGAAILARAGYRGVMIGSIALFAILAMTIAALPARQRVEAPAAAPPAARAQPARAGVTVAVAGPFVAFALLSVASWTYALDMPLFLVHTLSAPARDVGILVSVSAALEIPLMIGLGMLAARLTNRAIVLWGSLVGGAYYLLIALTTHVWAMFAGQVLEAAFIAVLMAIGISYFQDLMPEAAGVATTLYANASSIGRVAGSLAGGVLAQAMGLRGVFWVCLGLSGAAFLVLAYSHRAARRAPLPPAQGLWGGGDGRAHLPYGAKPRTAWSGASDEGSSVV